MRATPTTMQRLALGHFAIYECGQVHATVAHDTRGYGVTLLITDGRTAKVLYTGHGRGATCAQAVAAARAALMPPAVRVSAPVVRQLALFEVQR